MLAENTAMLVLLLCFVNLVFILKGISLYENATEVPMSTSNILLSVSCSMLLVITSYLIYNILSCPGSKSIRSALLVVIVTIPYNYIFKTLIFDLLHFLNKNVLWTSNGKNGCLNIITLLLNKISYN
jgi:hypothetical protein